MTIAEQIRKALLDEYNNGGKQQEMAAAHRVSQQYISRLLSGKRSCEGLSLKAVSNMFPHATLNLNGDTVSADNSGTNNGVVGVNNGTVTQSMDAVIDKILATDDLTAEEKIKVLKVLKK